MFAGTPAQILASAETPVPGLGEMLTFLQATEPNETTIVVLQQMIDELRAKLGQATAPQPARGLAGWQVKRVTAYMLEHLDEEIELGELATLVRLSRSHFCTAFRKATGQTPLQWLTVRRIERAKELLADPAASVTDVGLSVGYGTPSSFAASFRRVAGITPSDYRRSL
jgi:AraC family transcriptional regulator